MKVRLTLIIALCILALGMTVCGRGDSTPPEGMVRIPAGTFQMGSNFADEPNGVGAFRSEQPVHTVYVDAFYIDTHEVTNAQFKAFVDANPNWQKDRIDAQFNKWGTYLSDWIVNNYSEGKADHPVVYVSWYAAMAYAQWAGKRLPTEAEWEYAARGGLEGKKYPWGDTITADDTNYNENVGDTTPIGTYPPNGYGLYDMAGNVGEWCLDPCEADFYERSPVANPIAGGRTISWILENFTSIQTDPIRVLRGGAWTHSARHVRVALRGSVAPAYAGNLYGFRCVRAVTP